MIRREFYLKKLEMYVDRNIVKIITGVRRCGKTVLMKQFIELLKENGVPEECIFYVNLEGMIYSYINKTDDLREMLHAFIESCGAKHCYIFIDEAERVGDWAQVAAELMNLFDCDLYVSSSNSSIFRGEFARKLDYRYVKIDMYPFTFSEFLELKAAKRSAEAEIGADLPERSKAELFEEYISKGCMPGVYELKDGSDIRNYLTDLYNSIILKDVVQCNKLRDISHLDKIMEYILSHIGEAFSPKGIKDYVKQSGVTISVDTVYSFLDALTGAYLIYKIPRFDIKADRELETQEKYYICDMGMRNAVMGDEGASYEAMLESALCLELLFRGFKVNVAKQNSSLVDFMAVKGDDRTYLNCCVSVDDKDTVKRKFGPLTKIRDNYFKMVLSMDSETRINKGGIINYPLTEFLAQS